MEKQAFSLCCSADPRERRRGPGESGDEPCFTASSAIPMMMGMLVVAYARPAWAALLRLVWEPEEGDFPRSAH